MGQETPPPTPIRAPEADLSVIDLTRTAQSVRASGGLPAVKALYQLWIDANPQHPLLYAVLFNYSVVLTELGALDDAAGRLEQAIGLKPDFMPPYINLGRLYERRGAIDRALTKWNDVTAVLSPVTGLAVQHKTTALNQMARVLESQDQDETAETLLRQSLELDRHQRESLQHYLAARQRQCKWPVMPPDEWMSRDELLAGFSPLSLAAQTDDPMLQLAAAWNYNKRDVGAPTSEILNAHWGARESGEAARLRIGYLSSDLRSHAVGYLMAEVFELHDRSAVETFAYYCGMRGDDALQNRIKAAVDHWVPIHDLDDAQAARRIADDGVHILVDLNGYTKDARAKVIALRPAPVIVNWLGFPGTMASPYHHYLIADDWVIPPSHELYYSEKVLRLDCYQPNDRKREISATPARRDVGLPDDAMVYCCFNGAYKITPFVFDRWMTILKRVPNSVLWLLASNAATHDRLRNMASQQGVDGSRLIFAPKMRNQDHLARYAVADLFLDTTPYGAHTTASDALWVGLPVLTQSGRSFASRVCGSLVRAAGLPELNCDSAAEYVDRAVALGKDRALIARYRERLLAGRETSTLFDTETRVRNLEALYRQMWSEFHANRLPTPDLSNLDVYLEVASLDANDDTEVQSIKDYRAWWQAKLAKRHAFRAISPDHRFWPRKAASVRNKR